MALKTEGTQELVRQELERRLFHALAHPTRLRILEHLLEGEKSVSALVSLLGSPQGRVSNHLACLRWCGFVATRREGKNVYYSVADPRVRQLFALARSMLADNAEQVWACTRLDEEERAR